MTPPPDNVWTPAQPLEGPAACQVDSDGVVARCTPAFALQLGRPYHGLIGHPLRDLLASAFGLDDLPAALGLPPHGRFEHLAAGLRLTSTPLVEANGDEGGALVELTVGAGTQAAPTADDAEALERLAREQDARLEVEEAQRSLEFLYQTTSALFEEARDPKTLLERLAILCVPHLADWCIIDVVVGDGDLECVAAAHWDPQHQATARGLKRRWRPDRSASGGVARTARRGRSELVTAPPAASTSTSSPDVAMLSQLRARSWMHVPIVLRGHTSAVMTLAFAESTRVHSAVDLALAEDLAARAAIALDNARLFDEVQRAVRAREDALHIVSHDLKNPIAVLLLKAQRLMRVLPPGDEAARARAQVEQMERSIHHMNRLIEGLLDLARIEAGRLHLNKRPERPRALVVRALEPLHSLAHARRQRLDNRVPEDLPIIDCDPDRLAQVLGNLVGNAIKHIQEGGHIRVEAAVEGPDLRFTVADDGPGIDQEQLPHLFERFWQARAAGRQGHGLGLSIVQGLVAAHDGRVWVESEPGRGTRFHFTIPRTSEPSAAPAP